MCGSFSKKEGRVLTRMLGSTREIVASSTLRERLYGSAVLGASWCTGAETRWPEEWSLSQVQYCPPGRQMLPLVKMYKPHVVTAL